MNFRQSIPHCKDGRWTAQKETAQCYQLSWSTDSSLTLVQEAHHEYNWTVHVNQRCCQLVSDAPDQLFLFCWPVNVPALMRCNISTNHFNSYKMGSIPYCCAFADALTDPRREKKNTVCFQPNVNSNVQSLPYFIPYTSPTTLRWPLARTFWPIIHRNNPDLQPRLIQPPRC